mmetsp:Transcript_7305/g.21175  ORF Transcript_7305/g.21175 Transcript_7305/m.21175 type:complete len:200 (-) Transcript_7305:2327-2926(-)
MSTRRSALSLAALFLVVLVSVGQVSGAFYPLTSRTCNVRSARVNTDSGCVRQDPKLLRDAESSFAFVMSIRGGGIKSIVSEFNEYIGASKSRSWWVLVCSIVTDTYAVTLMKQAQAESSAKKLAMSYGGLFLSLSGFALALKSIDVSIAYAVWAAAGTAIVTIAGILFFGERLDATKIICLIMIILGVVGLEMSDRHSV